MRLLSLTPRWECDANRVVLREAFRLRWLLLGGYQKRVVIDRAAQTIQIASRVAWLWQSDRMVPFHIIREIAYGYEDLTNREWTWIFRGQRDQYDHFAVGLRLLDGAYVELWDFVGDGDYDNVSGHPDWAVAHLNWFNLTGNQESESRRLVDILSEITGKPVGHAPPR